MVEDNASKEWQMSDVLPAAFTRWLNELVTEKAMQERKSFMNIADEMGVVGPLLSRWLAGMGPLTQDHIRNLAQALSPLVYTTLSLKQPAG